MFKIKKISLEGLHNTRDLGGFPSKNGKTIKPHKLIRSGELFHLTKSDKETLQKKYNLKTIVDFRSLAEADEHPDPLITGVTYIHHPILNESALGITREKDADATQNKNILDAVLSSMSGNENGAREYMASLYHSLVTGEFSKSQYRLFFQMLLEHKDGSLLWHCTAGKDRAGTATVLLLNALDIPREIILEDYLKVNDFTKDFIDQKISMVYQRTDNPLIADKIRSLFSADEAYIDSIYTTIDANYGSMDVYLQQEMTLTKEKLIQLQDMYLI